MAFKYACSLGMTNMPSNNTLNTTYKMDSYWGTGGAYSSFSPLTINSANIITQVDYAIDNGYTGIVWDDEDNAFYVGLDQRVSSNATIDSVLDSLLSVYTQSKARATSRGYPNFQVAFYAITSFSTSPTDYVATSTYYNNQTDPTFLAWKNAKLRLNYRYTNGQLVYTPFSKSCDFVVPSLYTPYGRYDGQAGAVNLTLIDQAVQAGIVAIQTERLLHPVVKPYWTYAYQPSAQWSNLNVEPYGVYNMLNMLERYADGMIMWGFGPSWIYGDMTFRPVGVTNGTQESTLLTTWQGITNGAFNCYAASQYFKVTNINTSGATGMTSVANAIQTQMNASFAAGASSQLLDVSPNHSRVGSVTVTWSTQNKAFYFTHVNPTGPTGSLGPTGFTSCSQPPNQNRTLYNSGFFNFYGITGVQSSAYTFTGPAKDVSANIGPSYTNTSGMAPAGYNFIYKYIDGGGNVVSSRSQYEWDEYAANSYWWSEMTRRAAYYDSINSINTPNHSAGSGVDTIVVNGVLWDREAYEKLVKQYEYKV